MNKKHESLLDLQRRRGALRLTAAAIVGCVGIAVAGSSSSNGKEMPFVLNSDFVAKYIEPKVTLPKGAHALNAYTRYYAVERGSAGTIYVVGIFIHDAAATGIQIVELDDLPKRLDGGCDVIDVRYSVAVRRVLFIRCNGVA